MCRARRPVETDPRRTDGGSALTDTDPSITDIAIVGGGPAGLFAAFYAGLRALSVRLFEALPFLGGQIAALYPEKHIFDVGGFPEVRGADLVAALERQARTADPDIRLGEAVQGLVRETGGFRLTTARGVYRARIVLLAVGVGRFQPRTMGVDAVDRWAGRGLVHTVGDPARYAGAPVVVVGGGDSALDWAAELAEAGAHVTLLHRRDRFRGVEAAQARAERAGVTLRRPAVLEAIEGDARPERAVIRALPDGARERIPCATVVLALGFAADLSLMGEWGLPLEGRGLGVAPERMAVAPGIFAIGDAAVYAGKLKLIATAFAEAALAVSACATHLDTTARLQAGHSTALRGGDR